MGLSIKCDKEDYIHFHVIGEDLVYVDVHGNTRRVDEYDIWTGADLYAGFDDLKVDGDTGTESLYFEMNGFGFSLVYNAN